jgi:metallo-beta-lactamase class B
MQTRIFSTISLAILASLSCNPVHAQPALADAHFAAAKAIAGDNWPFAAEYFSMTRDEVDHLLPGRDDRIIAPTQVFDNLYVMGLENTVVWAITTSEGIVLIDCGYAETLDSVLLPAMRQLELDPALVKTVLISHGHGDHAGAAKQMQERFGSHIVVSQQDWELLESGNGQVATRDGLLQDLEPVTSGDTSILPVFIPGHTPGGMGFVFEVRDQGQPHMAALFGGTMLTATLPKPVIEQYLDSIEHFAWITSRAGVDVEIHNHPSMDGFYDKLDKLQTRKAGDPHPLVVGTQVYQDFLTVMYESMLGQLARRGELGASP